MEEGEVVEEGGSNGGGGKLWRRGEVVEKGEVVEDGGSSGGGLGGYEWINKLNELKNEGKKDE